MATWRILYFSVSPALGLRHSKAFPPMRRNESIRAQDVHAEKESTASILLPRKSGSYGYGHDRED